MSQIIKKLTRIKSQIEEAKTKKAQAEGRLEQLMDDLSKNHGCKDLIMAEKKLKTLNKKIDSLKNDLESGIEALEEAYDW